MNNEQLEFAAANLILDRGVRYKLGEGEITIRPLRYGTILVIAGVVAESGLTLERIETGDNDPFRLFVEFGDLMLRCVAAAELNAPLNEEDGIGERAAFYRENLSAFQVYELFVHVLHLSGIQSFKNTIRSLFMMKEINLSPKRVQGS